LPAAPAQCVLVTGATGLLGSYLVRDLLLEGRSVAVVVRRDRKQSAAERVAAILRHWEDTLGKRLPDPIVIEGDLTRPACGLDTDARRWVARHCDELLHNAASLTFRGPDRAGEPWRSNVGGTRHVLDLARETGLRHFHQVSTAYVCGLREGVVREDDLDVGQAFSNDYERSKVEAEALVHDACGRGPGQLESVTVYRPSIIVGDSRTGWTSTYHGFFAVLRLCHTLLARVPLGTTSGQALMDLLGVAGQSGKNFVPVDWVSSMIAQGVMSPAARGRTYHLTHPEPVTIALASHVVQDAIEAYSTAAAADDPEACDESWFVDNVASQIDIYRTYLRNDPVFDRSHAAVLGARLPCPALDRPTLMRMAKFAIDTDFGRRPPAARPVPAAASAHSPPCLASS